MTDQTVHGGLRGAIASEATKLFSVRVTTACLIGAAVLMLGFCTAVGVASRQPSERPLSASGISVSAVYYVAQFVLIALATLFITSEYASGSIRASLQWVPVRKRLLLAKGLVLAPVLFAVGVVLSGAGLGLAAVIKGDHGEPTTAAAALTTALTTGVYLALLGLLCLGVGTALRSTAATIVTVFVLLTMVPLMCGSVFSPKVVDYFPGFAGVNMMTPAGEPNALFGTVSPYSVWVGLLICAAWTAAALAAGTTVLHRRDA